MKIMLKKKFNSKITLHKTITPCQIGLTYFFLSLNDDYILTITILLKNEKKWRTIFFLCQTRLVCHVISWSNAHFRVTFCNIVQDKSSAVGTRGAGEWSPPPLQDFGRYVKSYFFMGAVYALTLILSPPPSGFSGLPTVLISLLFVAKTSDECTKENSAPDALGKVI